MLRFHSTPSTIFAMAVVLTCIICQSHQVVAQFGTCYYDSLSNKNICPWVRTPLVIVDPNDGQEYTLEDSALYVICDLSGSFSISACDCLIVIDSIPNAILDPADYCSSCTITSLTSSSFAAQYNCANQLTGNCVTFNSNGCQSNLIEDDPTPFPVESPTDFPTSPPEEDPTPSPVEAPTDFPTSPPEEDPTPSPVVAPTDFPTSPPEEDPTPPPVASTPVAPSPDNLPTPQQDDEDEEENNNDNIGNTAPVVSPKNSTSPVAAPTSSSVRGITTSGGDGGINAASVGISIAMFSTMMTLVAPLYGW